MTLYEENTAPGGSAEKVVVPNPMDSFVFGDPTPGHMKRSIIQAMLEAPTTVEFTGGGNTNETGHITEVGVERIWEVPDLGFDEYGVTKTVIDPTSAINTPKTTT